MSAAADNQLPLRASIGASLYPRDGADADALYLAADNAMYTDKRDYRSRADRAA
jgi:GGDEF domain-containing protein